MKSIRLRAAATALLVALGVSAPTLAADPGVMYIAVTYQCGEEPPGTFTYSYNGNNRATATMPMIAEQHAQWYWNRTRADKGTGCKIVKVN